MILPICLHTGKPKQFVQLRNLQSQPEIGKGMIGVVVSHPFHTPGTDVVTSPVLSIYNDLVETRSSVYLIVKTLDLDSNI